MIIPDHSFERTRADDKSRRTYVFRFFSIHVVILSNLSNLISLSLDPLPAACHDDETLACERHASAAVPMQPPVTPPVATGAAAPSPPPATLYSQSQPSPPPLSIASTKTGRRQLLVSSSLLLAASTAAGARAAGDEGALAGYVGPPPVVTEAERAASAAVSRRVGEAVGLQARGEFPEALASFTRVVREYADLALSEYARVGRALVLYEIGDRDESIAEMEDVSIALKGYPGRGRLFVSQVQLMSYLAR
jgi:hypothetical protein